MSVSNPQSSTPPLHAEVRQKVDAIFLRKYNDLHDNFFESEFEAAKAAADEVLQAVADALLAELPKQHDTSIFKRSYTIDEMMNPHNTHTLAFRNGYNSALDAVTRVIGELRGDSK